MGENRSTKTTIATTTTTTTTTTTKRQQRKQQQQRQTTTTWISWNHQPDTPNGKSSVRERDFSPIY